MDINMFKSYLTSSPGQTKKIGFAWAKLLKKQPRKKALVLGLVGDLGGGKTTFLQGLAKGLGVKGRILSPTFILIRRHKLANFFHIDCYRIQKPKELLDLGFKDIISSPGNIAVVEWADRVKKIMPQGTIWIDFKFIDNKTRKIVIR